MRTCIFLTVKVFFTQLDLQRRKFCIDLPFDFFKNSSGINSYDPLKVGLNGQIWPLGAEILKILEKCDLRERRQGGPGGAKIEKNRKSQNGPKCLPNDVLGHLGWFYDHFEYFFRFLWSKFQLKQADRGWVGVHTPARGITSILKKYPLDAVLLRWGVDSRPMIRTRKISS